MVTKHVYTKDNLKVLGIVIRSKRMELGLSLRDLSDITKISHTLISNIEKGKQSPASDTLRDILNALELEFYDSEDLLNNMTDLSVKMMVALINQEYEDAKDVYNELHNKEEQYMYSPQLINYIIVKYLYFAQTNKQDTDIEKVLDHYSKMIEFFNPVQTQLFNYIQGLNHLNNERYNKSLINFNNALGIGNKEYDVFVKQYLVVAKVRQYQFMDAYKIAKEIISEFEARTIYLRSMQTKLQIARIYYVINKTEDIERILSQVRQFANKFNMVDLIEECLLIEAAVQIRAKEYTKAEETIDKMPNQESIPVALHRFKLARVQNQISKMLKLYGEIMEYPEVKRHYKVPKFIKMQAMHKIPALYDEEEYLETVNELCDRAVENNDQDVIGIAYNYLLDFYHTKRQYKKAMEVAESFLQHKRILQKL